MSSTRRRNINLARSDEFALLREVGRSTKRRRERVERRVSKSEHRVRDDQRKPSRSVPSTAVQAKASKKSASQLRDLESEKSEGRKEVRRSNSPQITSLNPTQDFPPLSILLFHLSPFLLISTFHYHRRARAQERRVGKGLHQRRVGGRRLDAPALGFRREVRLQARRRLKAFADDEGLCGKQSRKS